MNFTCTWCTAAGKTIDLLSHWVGLGVWQDSLHPFNSVTKHMFYRMKYRSTRYSTNNRRAQVVVRYDDSRAVGKRRQEPIRNPNIPIGPEM